MLLLVQDEFANDKLLQSRQQRNVALRR